MNQQDGRREPLVIAFVDDLMSSTRIRGVASDLGYQIKIIGQADSLASGSSAALPGRPGEPVEGPLAIMMDRLTAWQPALLVFDLANKSIPWRQWLSVLKASPATRRIPVICYGPHVDKVTLSDAASVTAEGDAVLPRSKFFSNMPNLFSDMARVTDRAAIVEDCLSPLPASALQGLQAFNRGEYFEAHEFLEDAWNGEHGPIRELYRAVLQIAVAYLQIERHNYPGALKMFLRARGWLAPLPDTCRGIDLARLRRDAEKAHSALLELGPERIDDFDLGSLEQIHYTVNDSPLNGLGATTDVS